MGDECTVPSPGTRDCLAGWNGEVRELRESLWLLLE
jgi:hypothetical protein